MLSKSQARIFFLGGTIVFGGIFIALTIDSMQRVPEQTRDAELTEQAIHGKEIWEKNNCMGCHTLFGEGAYYAPELTKVVERRGETWIKTFLKDPQAMFPGERKMVQYNFTAEEIDAVYAFLDWCGKVDLNGFPADPPLKSQVISTAPSAASTELSSTASLPQGHSEAPPIFSSLCIACHSINGAGANVGPALDTVKTKFTRAELKNWISDPLSVKPDTKMPKLPLTEDQLNSVVDYLLGTQAAPINEGDES